MATALVGAYVLASLCFSRRFLPGTTINGQDVSLETPDAYVEQLEERVATYAPEVHRADFSLRLDGSGLDLSCDGGAVADEARAGLAGPGWLPALLRSRAFTLDLHVSYDQDALGQQVRDAVEAYDETASQPTDATIGWDEASSSFVARDGATADALDADATLSAVEQGIGALDDPIELGDDALMQPKVQGEDDAISQALEDANASVCGDIPLTVDGSQVWNLERAQVAQWVTLDGSGHVTLDEAQVVQWAQDQLSPSVSHTEGDTEYLVDCVRLARKIASDVAARATYPVEVPFWTRAVPPAVSASDVALGRHVDVDLARQYARLFDESGNVIWDSYIVSGDPAEGHGTPTGTFHLLDKATNETLTGSDANGDGRPDYVTVVDYWMPFIGNTWAFHDASWRSKFGGDIYDGSGSHGCINLPHDKAAELYGLIEIGDTIVVHS